MKPFAWVVVLMLALPIACGLAGLGIGWSIGTWMPDYYRAYFRNRAGAVMPRGLNGERALEEFNPVAFGMGQGLTQGVGAGVGLAALAGVVSAWWAKRSRMQQQFDVLASEVHDLRQAVLRLDDAIRRP